LRLAKERAHLAKASGLPTEKNALHIDNKQLFYLQAENFAPVFFRQRPNRALFEKR
jgi:hypothetical protein